jgi:hypothetical protein
VEVDEANHGAEGGPQHAVAWKQPDPTVKADASPGSERIGSRHQCRGNKGGGGTAGEEQKTAEQEAAAARQKGDAAKAREAADIRHGRNWNART